MLTSLEFWLKTSQDRPHTDESYLCHVWGSLYLPWPFGFRKHNIPGIPQTKKGAVLSMLISSKKSAAKTLAITPITLLTHWYGSYTSSVQLQECCIMNETKETKKVRECLYWSHSYATAMTAIWLHPYLYSASDRSVIAIRSSAHVQYFQWRQKSMWYAILSHDQDSTRISGINGM